MFVLNWGFYRAKNIHCFRSLKFNHCCWYEFEMLVFNNKVKPFQCFRIEGLIFEVEDKYDHQKLVSSIEHTFKYIWIYIFNVTNALFRTWYWFIWGFFFGGGVAVEIWPGGLIRIPRSRWIFNQLRSKFNTSGLNIPR